MHHVSRYTLPTLATLVICLAFVVMLPPAVMAGPANKAVTTKAPVSCESCRQISANSRQCRVKVTFTDLRSVGVCSLACCQEAIAGSQPRKIKQIDVADYHTSKLIDAKKAHWVIGGDVPERLSKLPTWAFEKSDDAQRFIAEHGGRIAPFHEAWRIPVR